MWPDRRLLELFRIELPILLAPMAGTALTNLFAGRPARGLINRVMREVGPLYDDAPAFPLAGGALAPLKAAAEAKGSSDFSSLWAGQAGSMGREMSAAQLTRELAHEALERLNALAHPRQTRH
jgi:nitronate monooxygenase